MKISPKQYAQALYEISEGKEGKELEDIIARFAAVLKKNGDLSKAGEVIACFKRIAQAEAGEIEAEIQSARPLGKESRETILGYVASKTGAKKIELSENVIPGLLGGFIVRYEGKIIDASLRSNLERLSASLHN